MTSQRASCRDVSAGFSSSRSRTNDYDCSGGSTDKLTEPAAASLPARAARPRTPTRQYLRGRELRVQKSLRRPDGGRRTHRARALITPLVHYLHNSISRLINTDWRIIQRRTAEPERRGRQRRPSGSVVSNVTAIRLDFRPAARSTNDAPAASSSCFLHAFSTVNPTAATYVR